MNRPTQELLSELADHFEAIAGKLRHFADGGDSRPLERGEPDPSRPDALQQVEHFDPGDAVNLAKSIHPLLGSHQELAIRRLAEAHPNGLSASQINPNPSTQPNTYMTLDKLAELRLVRRDDQTHPRRYYLGPRMLG